MHGGQRGSTIGFTLRPQGGRIWFQLIAETTIDVVLNSESVAQNL
jgi:hypothetical protein